MKKNYIVFSCLMAVCYQVMGGDTANCNKKGRCINHLTNPMFNTGLSLKPKYKNVYEIKLIGPTDRCYDEEVQKTLKLPKNSRFRETLNNNDENSNEMLVHIYEVDKGKLSKGEEIDEYFGTSFKVCLKGHHEVRREFYRRIGGVNTGVLVVPFKLRDGDIYSDATIGPFISYKLENVEWLATAGLAQISVSEIGSEDIQNENGLTGAIGISFEVDTNWDVSFLVGKDYMSGDKGDAWEHQGETWLSFGIGFNFTK